MDWSLKMNLKSNVTVIAFVRTLYCAVQQCTVWETLFFAPFWPILECLSQRRTGGGKVYGRATLSGQHSPALSRTFLCVTLYDGYEEVYLRYVSLDQVDLLFAAARNSKSFSRISSAFQLAKLQSWPRERAKPPFRYGQR